jgi:hypothetical protein
MTTSTRTLRGVTALCAALLLAPGVAAAQTTAQPDVSQPTTIQAGDVSYTNWSGYITRDPNGYGYTAVRGKWVQPALNCSNGHSTHAAFWVGIGGNGPNTTLQQGGVDAYCYAGVAHYHAFFEFVPRDGSGGEQWIGTGDTGVAFTVHPGDVMVENVWRPAGTNTWYTRINDVTTGNQATFAKTLSSYSADTAEWVAEAPSVGGAPSRLANFGRADFYESAAASGGVTRTIAQSHNWRMLMTNPAVTDYRAIPSMLASTGNAFSVYWKNEV